MSLTLIFVIITVIASLYAWSNQDVLSRWMLNPYSVKRSNQYYRFVTSGLIHSDYIHLFFNMFALYTFGNIVEQHFAYQFPGMGKTLYGLLYLLSIIVSDIPTFIKHKDHPHYNSLGASGGVSAIVFAFILLYPMMPLSLMFIPIPLPGFVFGGLYMLYSYFQAKRGGDYINHDAHMYGALFGIVFTVVIIPTAITNFIEQVLTWRIF